MEPNVRADQAYSVMSAAGHEVNEELTIILSAVTVALDQLAVDDPSREALLEIRQAAQRVTWKASALLNYASRNGARKVRASLNYLVEW